jgi:hypothetical protein
MNEDETRAELIDPKIEKITKCNCDTPDCAKCLAVTCKDDECLVHTKEAKERWKKRRGI